MEGYRWLMRCPVCGTYFNTEAGKEPEKAECERCNYEGEFAEFLEYEVAVSDYEVEKGEK